MVNNKETMKTDVQRLTNLINCSSSCGVFDSLVCATAQELLIKYSCHVCNKNTIKKILKIASKFEPSSLCVDFVTQIGTNLSLNKKKLDWELVKLIATTIKNVLRNKQGDERVNFINGTNLLSVARMLLSRFVLRNDDDLDKSLIEDVLDILRMALGVAKDYHPDERLADNLIKCFPIDPWKAFFVAWFTVKSINNVEEYSKFWEDFTTGVHKACRDKWESDQEFALEYAMIITNYRKPFANKIDYCFRKHLAKMIEVVRRADIMSSQRILAFVTLHDEWAEVALTKNSVDFYSKNISWLLTNEPVTLNHDVCLLPIETSQKLTDGINSQSNKSKYKNMSVFDDLAEAILQQINEITHFDHMDLVNSLIRLAFHDQFICDQSYKYLVVQAVRSYGANIETMTSKIPRTISQVINNLHETCSTCDKIFVFMNELTTMITPPAFEILLTLHEGKSTTLATSIPYAVRNKQKLFYTMYLDGFALLMKQLEQGEDVESLHLLAKTLRPDLGDTWKTISCANHPIHRSRCNAGTRVFVLDDGTKIRAKISHLVKNSEYFSRILNESLAEASHEEVRLSDVTAFQFNFIACFIEAKPSAYERNYDMDAQAHLDLIILCDQLMLHNLRDSVVDSLRWHHMTEESCSEVYRASLLHGISSLRKACVNFALFGDINVASSMKCLQNLFVNFDKKLLVEDIREWLRDEYERVQASLPFDYWARPHLSELVRLAARHVSDAYEEPVQQHLDDISFISMKELGREAFVEISKRCRSYSKVSNNGKSTMPF